VIAEKIDIKIFKNQIDNRNIFNLAEIENFFRFKNLSIPQTTVMLPANIKKRG
jgi:hypothetical protein